MLLFRVTKYIAFEMFIESNHVLQKTSTTLIDVSLILNKQKLEK